MRTMWENSGSVRVGGGVGKGLAYGARGGLFISRVMLTVAHVPASLVRM